MREYDQAKNLYERMFKNDPNARVVVNAGYAHIQENGKYLGGQSMAQHFRKLSGIDPLTIEQTMLIEHPPGTENHPYYHPIIESLKPAAPIVFVDGKGEPWTLKPKAYDVSVFFPPDVIENDRPTWLDLGGLRKPYSVSGSQFCQDQYPCLIEARYAERRRRCDSGRSSRAESGRESRATAGSPHHGQPRRHAGEPVPSSRQVPHPEHERGEPRAVSRRHHDRRRVGAVRGGSP